MGEGRDLTVCLVIGGWFRGRVPGMSVRDTIDPRNPCPNDGIIGPLRNRVPGGSDGWREEKHWTKLLLGFHGLI